VGILSLAREEERVELTRDEDGRRLRRVERGCEGLRTRPSLRSIKSRGPALSSPSAAQHKSEKEPQI
jgi:hypothetical protein